MTRSQTRFLGFAALTMGLLAASPAHAGSWQNSFAFGATLKGDLYTPTTLASSPAVLVAIHMCTGHSSTVHGWFDKYADTNGFYIIAPDAGKQCFDASATRDGDKAAIVKMVDYLVTMKGADKSRVFAAGMSSGGCMTNTLLAIYPDVFAGGSAMPGFPAGGWPAGDTTCTKCSSSPPSTDGKYWGDIARKAFSWSGKYPCSQQWVGGGDEYNFNGWLPAAAAQFQNLSTLGSGMSATGRSGWARTVYKDSAGNVRLETNLGPSSQKHDLETVNPTLYGDVITFLSLDKPTGACGIATGGTGAGGAGGGGTGTGGSAGPGSAGSKAGAGGSASGSGGSIGTTGKGGATAANGGNSGTAGATGAAGSPSTSGVAGSSSTGVAGSTGSGGSSSTGVAGSSGEPSTGVAGSSPTGAAGSSSSGAAGHPSTGAAGSSAAGTAGHGEDDSSGCSVAGRSQAGTLAMLAFVALGLVMRRRSRARR
jgi:acetylxylan esterase